MGIHRLCSEIYPLVLWCLKVAITTSFTMGFLDFPCYLTQIVPIWTPKEGWVDLRAHAMDSHKKWDLAGPYDNNQQY